MATLSLLGLYNYDESLLDGLIESLPNRYGIPSGYADSYYTDVIIDPQTVVENLLVECAEFEILYSDFNALKRIIKIWSAKEKLVWQKMYNTICYKYNPIWNKDGKSVWTERQSATGKKTETEKGSKTTNANGTTNDEYTTTSNTTNKTTGTGTNTRTGSDETTGKVSAYDSTDFQNREKTNSTASENNSTESTEDFTGNGKVTNSGTKTIVNTGDETNNVSRETSDNNTGETRHETSESR